MPTSRGFTLVELLVVITIIVVLLALLAPAMDQAIYQAALAVCATHQWAIAVGAVGYAMGSKRSYPYRKGVREGTVWEATTVYNGDPRVNAFYAGLGAETDLTIYDDRPILRTFLSLNGHLNDPLTGRIDLEATDDDSNVDSVSSLWFGWGYPGKQKMNRIGDRWASRDKNKDEDVWFFDVLASDTDLLNGTMSVQCSHPDAEGRMVNAVLQNQDNGLPDKFTKSFWHSKTGRGMVDLNYAFQDGSVSRYAVERGAVGLPDPEMAMAPHYAPNGLGWWATLPPQRR